ncbi:MAG: cache domain-containing protein, partial [Coleofasciculaceae cyanobacterium]
MSIPIFSNLVSLIEKKASLRTVLVVPFVLQIVGAVGLVGYLSYRSGQNDVENLANQLMEEKGNRVEQYLDTYLAVPHQINRMNVDAVRLGQLNLQNSSAIERYLFWQIQQFEKVATIIFGSNRGEFIAGDRWIGQLFIMASAPSNNTEISMYASDSLANRGELFKQFQQPDARERPWYQAAVKAGKPTWTEIFQLGDNSDLAINATRPIYDNATKELLGVFSVNLNLGEVNKFIEGLKVGKSGEVFIIEKNGLLVANSVHSNLYNLTNKQIFKRLKATNSENYLISKTSQLLTERFGNFNNINNLQKLNFKIEGEQKFLQLLPYQDEFGLDWLIVVVVPESDFMAQIYANTRTTIALCVVTLVGAIGVGTITAGWITQPLLQLNTAAKKLTQGKWDETILINRRDEVGQLAASFVEMATQLQQSFAKLQGNKSRLNQILEAIPVGIVVHDITGQLTYANAIAKELLGIEVLPNAKTEQLAVTYQVYQGGTEQLYPTENLPAVRALQGEKVRVEDMELRLQERRIPLEVYGTPLLDETGKIIGAIAAFADISERKLAEKIFADYN